MATLVQPAQKIVGNRQYTAMRKSGGTPSLNSLCRWIEEILEIGQTDRQMGGRRVNETRTCLANMVPLVTLGGKRDIVDLAQQMERLAEYPEDKFSATTLLFFAPPPAFLTRHVDMDWHALAETIAVFMENPCGRKNPQEPGMYVHQIKIG